MVGLDQRVVAAGRLPPPRAAENEAAPCPLSAVSPDDSLSSPPTNRFTRPAPASVVNSLSEIPILRSKHSSASEPPVVSAIRGRWPSLLLRGSRVRSALPTTFAAHAVTLGMVTWRRHLPTWMTSGTSAPLGTSVSTNLPFASESAVAMGLPDRVTLHRSHETPSGTESSGAFGM